MFSFYLAINCELCHLLWVVPEVSVQFFQPLLCCFESVLRTYHSGRGQWRYVWCQFIDKIKGSSSLLVFPLEFSTHSGGSHGCPESFLFSSSQKDARVSIQFLVAVAQSQATLRLLPLSGQRPLKAGDCLSLWGAPHFESPLQSACLWCTVQNPQVIGFCVTSRICSCYHWEGWSIGSLYNKTCMKSSVLSVFSLCIIKQLCVLDESTPLTL